jgi:hypothetical protein
MTAGTDGASLSISAAADAVFADAARRLVPGGRPWAGTVPDPDRSAPCAARLNQARKKLTDGPADSADRT